MLIAFLKLIRWKNLLLILYVLLLLKFLVFNSFHIITNLSLIPFIILLLSVLLITSAGYIINDIYDLKADLINKPKKVIVSKYYSLEKSQQLYLWLNSMGIILGIGLCLHLETPSYALIFIGTSLLLYYYTKKFKSKPFIGNFIVASLIALSIGILYIFDIDSTIQTKQQQLVNYLILSLIIIAFFLNLIREIVKDIIDVKGDYMLNMNTLPIYIGSARAKKITIFLSLVTIGILLFIIFNFTAIYQLTIVYLVVFVTLPLFYTTIKLASAKSQKEYQRISIFLKLIMFFGINTLIIFSTTS